MKYKMNPWAVAVFACAMTPNLIAVGSVLRGFLQPSDPGSMDPRSFGVLFALFTVALTLLFGFVGRPNYLTGPLGAGGIVLAVIAMRKRGAWRQSAGSNCYDPWSSRGCTRQPQTLHLSDRTW